MSTILLFTGEQDCTEESLRLRRDAFGEDVDFRFAFGVCLLSLDFVLNLLAGVATLKP